MLHNLPSLYVVKSMSKSSLNFIHKRAHAVVNILRYDMFMDLQKLRKISLNLIFYNFQIIPDIILFVCVYIIALSIAKLCTICQCL